MAYNEHLAERIHQVFREKHIAVEEKKMMGGCCFLMNNKMCIGLDTDKKTGKDRLMARVGPEAEAEALKKTGSKPMDFTGRPMKGYVFVDPEGFDMDEDLEYWVQKTIDFNPFAKSSKKK